MTYSLPNKSRLLKSHSAIVIAMLFTAGMVSPILAITFAGPTIVSGVDSGGAVHNAPSDWTSAMGTWNAKAAHYNPATHKLVFETYRVDIQGGSLSAGTIQASVESSTGGLTKVGNYYVAGPGSRTSASTGTDVLYTSNRDGSNPFCIGCTDVQDGVNGVTIYKSAPSTSASPVTPLRRPGAIVYANQNKDLAAWYPNGQWMVASVEMPTHAISHSIGNGEIGMFNDLWAISADGKTWVQLTDFASTWEFKDPTASMPFACYDSANCTTRCQYSHAGNTAPYESYSCSSVGNAPPSSGVMRVTLGNNLDGPNGGAPMVWGERVGIDFRYTWAGSLQLATAELVMTGGLPTIIGYKRNMTPMPSSPDGLNVWVNRSPTKVIAAGYEPFSFSQDDKIIGFGSDAFTSTSDPNVTQPISRVSEAFTDAIAWRWSDAVPTLNDISKYDTAFAYQPNAATAPANAYGHWEDAIVFGLGPDDSSLVDFTSSANLNPAWNPSTSSNFGLDAWVIPLDRSQPASRVSTFNVPGTRIYSYPTASDPADNGFFLTVLPAGSNLPGNLYKITEVVASGTQVLTTITVAPVSPTMSINATQKFTASGFDQSGNPMNPQPNFTWTVSGGGAIDSSGLFTPSATGGPLTVTAAASSVSGTAQVTVGDPNVIPPDTSVTKWAEINNELTTDLNNYASTIASNWNGQKYAGAHFSADIYPADNAANNRVGTDPAYLTNTVFPWIDAMAGLGIKAMKVTVSFPVLYPDYYTYLNGGDATKGAAQYNATVAAYQQIAQHVRSKALKLIVVSLCVAPWENPRIVNYYPTLGASGDLTKYKAGRSQVLITLAKTMNPDYLIMQPEPQTESDNIKVLDPALSLNNPSTDAAMLQGFITDLGVANIPGLHTTMLLGTGMGTWQLNFEDGAPATPGFKNAIVGLTNLDLVDIHVYPVYTIGGSNFLDRIAELATAAHSHGKKAGMSEAWAYKEQSAEAIKGATTTEIYSRDIYSFWSTLDTLFLKNMVNVTHWQQLEFMSPFFDQYFLAYTDYLNTPSPCGPFSTNPPDVMCQGTTGTPNANNLTVIAKGASGAALGSTPIPYTATGLAYKLMIATTQTLTTITVAPTNQTVGLGQTQAFTASAFDQFGNAMSTPPTFTWTVSGGGSITSSGLFTAGIVAGGPYTVAAASGGKSGSAQVMVADGAPTVATAASALPNPVTGTNTTLSVLGSDAAGQSSLTYAWAPIGVPPAPVSFSRTGTNAAQSAVATFTKAGTYSLQATITNPSGLHANSVVTVLVSQTLTTITVAPTNQTVGLGQTQAFTASAFDQFGNAMSTPPTFTWTVSGGGSITSFGLFNAGTTVGAFTVTATAGGKTGATQVTVASTVPTPISVSINSPAEGSTVSGTIRITASVSGTIPVAKMEFRVDGALVGTLLSAPYNFDWDSSLAADGDHTLALTALDASNNPTSAEVHVLVNNTSNAALPPPTLNLPSDLPVNGTLTVGYPPSYDIAYFQWSITPVKDPNAGNGVAADAPVASFPTPQKTADLSILNLRPGMYVITVVAADGSGRLSAPASAIVTLLSSDLPGFRVYPNPWRSDRHSGMNLSFDHLTAGCTIKIFDTSAHLIKTLTAASDNVGWDLTNESGHKVSSGIYIYYLTDAAGAKAHGKFTIIN